VSGPTTLQWRNRSQAFIGTNPATAQVRTGARKTSGCAVTQDTPEREHDKFAPLERLRVIGFLRERSTSQEESKAPSACSGSFPPLGRTGSDTSERRGIWLDWIVGSKTCPARFSKRFRARDFRRRVSPAGLGTYRDPTRANIQTANPASRCFISAPLLDA